MKLFKTLLVTMFGLMLSVAASQAATYTYSCVMHETTQQTKDYKYSPKPFNVTYSIDQIKAISFWDRGSTDISRTDSITKSTVKYPVKLTHKHGKWFWGMAARSFGYKFTTGQVLDFNRSGINLYNVTYTDTGYAPVKSYTGTCTKS